VLAVAALAVAAVVPEWPLAGVTNPSYWGVAGFLVFVLLVLFGGGTSWSPGSLNRRLVITFLVGLQLVYVANWMRFGGSSLELGVQLGGLLVWLAFAAVGRRSDTALWIGCVLHGLWDAVHFGRIEFVPQWYGALCIAADVAVGAYVLNQLARSTAREWGGAFPHA
jgi:hypothetical protein